MRVLIVDDDPVAVAILTEAVRRCGHEPLAATDGEEGWRRYQAEVPEVIVSDWHMPPPDGLELCRRVRDHPGPTYTYFILLTVSGGRENLRRAIDAGVDDFLTKPLDPFALEVRLKVAARITRLEEEKAAAETRAAHLEAAQGGAAEGLVGETPVMGEVRRRLALAARSDVTVLLTGESGTGKELAARAIHRASRRREGPFLAVNCGALPDTLLASELFGHAKGAFTGADRNRPGLFEAAHGGTLFLDEVGDVSPAMQRKLLRVLENREIQRVGEHRPRRVDVRLVTATNRDLADLVAAGAFRRDLYYRVRVFEIRLPPLRERRRDIPLLAEALLRELAAAQDRPPPKPTAAARRCLLEYPWPGNVRELRNALEHALVLAAGEVLDAEHLPPEVRDPALRHPGLMGEPMLTPAERAERERLRAALAAVGGSRTEAAKRLGISRVTLGKKLRRYGLG